MTTGRVRVITIDWELCKPVNQDAETIKIIKTVSHKYEELGIDYGARRYLWTEHGWHAFNGFDLLPLDHTISKSGTDQAARIVPEDWWKQVVYKALEHDGMAEELGRMIPDHGRVRKEFAYAEPRPDRQSR